jgi:folate-binding protein YgfZ
MSTPPAEIQTQYEALQSAVGIAHRRDRTQIELTGKDRALFLHGFCTNDIKRLEPGQGCEAFLTNGQGKTIAFVNIFCEVPRLVIETAPGQAEHIIASLDRYLIREDVQLTDRTESWHELLLAGPEAAGLIEQVLGANIELEPLHHLRCTWLGQELAVRRIDYTRQPDYLIAIETGDWQACWDAFGAAAATPCDEAAVEIARIEAGTPNFVVDISDDNLPQEVDRDSTAISFTKGCYLGQETVARIDALGRVNRLFRGLRILSDEIPPRGTEFVRDDKVVARVTSACWSYMLQAPLALAYVRRELSSPGSRLESSIGDAEVVALPLV